LIYKEANQSFDLRAIPVSHVCSDNDVILLRVMMQLRGKSCEQRHKKRDALSLAEFFEGLC
jgi:hypothetical protein